MKINELTLGCKSGKEYENRVLKYLQELGFQGKIIGYDDCGVDIIATIKVKNVTKTFNIQCKYYNTTVGKQPVHEVFSGSNYYNNKGVPVVITNNKMTMKALEFAKKQGVEVISEYEWAEVENAENNKEILQNFGLLGIIIGKLLKDSNYIINATKGTQRAKVENKNDKLERQFMEKVERKQWEGKEKLKSIAEFIGSKASSG